MLVILLGFQLHKGVSMQGYLGRTEGLRATLYLEFVPSGWFPLNNPFFSSESNTLGLTAPVSESVAACRFRTNWEEPDSLSEEVAILASVVAEMTQRPEEEKKEETKTAPEEEPCFEELDDLPRVSSSKKRSQPNRGSLDSFLIFHDKKFDLEKLTCQLCVKLCQLFLFRRRQL